MKRLLFSLLCMLGALCAGAVPWAELNEIVQRRSAQNTPEAVQPAPPKQTHGQANGRSSRQFVSHPPAVESVENSPAGASQQVERGSMLPKILRGQTLRVHVFVATQKLPLDRAHEEAMQKMVANAYNAWFQNALKVIEAEGRLPEFQDVLPLLRRGISTQVEVEGKLKAAMEEDILDCVAHKNSSLLFAGDEDVAITIGADYTVVSKYCGGGSACEGDYEDGTATVVINDWKTSPYYHGEGWTEEDYLQTTLEHELGHTLGMADAYQTGYEQNASPTHRSEKRTDDTMMNHQSFFEEDDADGIINMIDSWNNYRLRKQYGEDWCAHVSPRVKNGWESLDLEEGGYSIDRYAMGTSVSLLSKLPTHERCDLPARPSASLERGHPSVKRPLKKEPSSPAPTRGPRPRTKMPPASADN